MTAIGSSTAFIEEPAVKAAPRICTCCRQVHAFGEACPRAAARAQARDNRPSARARGYDGDWQSLRVAHLAAHPRCIRCVAPAVVVDHVEPVRLAPHRRLDPTNLQSLCRSCHSKWAQSLERRGLKGKTGGAGQSPAENTGTGVGSFTGIFRAENPADDDRSI